MELDDLKKSWNALDEHLKNKEHRPVQQETAFCLDRHTDISGALLDMRRHTYRPFLLDNPLTVHPGSLLGFVLRPLPEPDPDR